LKKYPRGHTELRSLGLSERKSMIEPKLQNVSLSQQCALLRVNRSSYYYQEQSKGIKTGIKSKIVDIFEEVPIYGAAKVY